MLQKPLTIRTAAVLLLFAAAVFFSLFSYQARLSADLKARAHTLLTESASDHADSIGGWIDNQFTMLGALGDYIGGLEEHPSVKDQLDLMNSLASTGDLHTVGLSSETGYTLLNNGKRVWLAETDYVRSSLAGTQVASYVENTTFANYPALILSIPIEREGEPVGALFAVYRMEQITQLLVSAAFHGEGSLMLVDADGVVLARQVQQDSPLQAGNLFDSLADLLEPQELPALRDELRQQESAVMSFRHNGGDRYGVFQPIGINGWMLYIAVSAEAVEEEYAFVYNGATRLTVLLTAAFLGLILFVLWQDSRTQRILHQEKEQLRQSEERYRLVEELTDTVMFEIDFVARMLTLNHNYKQVYGHDTACMPFADGVAPSEHVYPEDLDSFLILWDTMRMGQEPSASADIRIVDAEGNPVWSRIDAMVLADSSGAATRVVGKIYSIEQQMAQMELLRSMAGQDALTHLLNRKSFKAEVDSFLASDVAGGLHAFLMIDVDDFKQVNDTYGHFEGDRVLGQIADIMRDSLRTSDILGRLGGDEFAVLMKSAGSLEFTEQKVRELCNRVSALTSAEGVHYNISCSVGIAACVHCVTTFDELYKNADAALYEAKRMGKNRWVFAEEAFDGDSMK